jgi:hypothetical protein
MSCMIELARLVKTLQSVFLSALEARRYGQSTTLLVSLLQGCSEVHLYVLDSEIHRLTKG